MQSVKKLIISLVIFLSIPLLVLADEQPEPRLITVFGEAEVRVVPDEIILKLKVETLNKDLNLSKKENDQRTKKVFDVARKNNIEEKHIQTDYISIKPAYDYRGDDKDVFIGFRANKSIVLEIRDISKFEEILSDILEAGANYVNDVTFRTTELQKYRDQARSLAIKAAREKADKLAMELGQKVGKPYLIQEDGVQSNPWGRTESLRGTQKIMDADGDSSTTGESIALGQIKVSAKIIVCFELLEP